jgi:dTDP-4-amino-4,6-dideoxygalactose transaminase
VRRAEVLQEKGTNRAEFFRGEVDKYTWVDVGSSFLLSEVSAAFLWAQLERAEAITARRLRIWNAYFEAFASLEQAGVLRRPLVPSGCHHNAHMFYLLMKDRSRRDALIAALADRGIHAVFHYVPLHSSSAGRLHGRSGGDLSVTDDVSGRVLRLPLWPGMDEDAVRRVVEGVFAATAPDLAAGAAR